MGDNEGKSLLNEEEVEEEARQSESSGFVTKGSKGINGTEEHAKQVDVEQKKKTSSPESSEYTLKLRSRSDESSEYMLVVRRSRAKPNWKEWKEWRRKEGRR